MFKLLFQLLSGSNGGHVAKTQLSCRHAGPLFFVDARSESYACLRLAAQYFLIRSAAAARCALENVRFLRGAGLSALSESAAATAFLGGRPRRLGPCKASMARSILSRSATRRRTISSVDMNFEDIMSAVT